MLVTSKQSLHVRGEQQVAVEPLKTPNLSGPLTAESVARSPAVALFVERAQAAQPDFALNDHNAPFLAAICAHLDGLPLAIELVAARVKMLSLRDTQFARRDSLAGRTLREAIDWSYEQLT